MGVPYPNYPKKGDAFLQVSQRYHQGGIRCLAPWQQWNAGTSCTRMNNESAQ